MRLRPWRKQAELSRDFPGSETLGLLRDGMDRLFDSFFAGTPWEGSLSSAGTWSPDLEISETDKEILVKAETPGLGPEDIEIRIAGNVLTLSGEKKEESEDKKGGYYRSERRYGSFYRTLTLPAGSIPDSVIAEYDKGVLTLRIAKDESTSARKVEIKTSASGKPEQPGRDKPKR